MSSSPAEKTYSIDDIMIALQKNIWIDVDAGTENVHDDVKTLETLAQIKATLKKDEPAPVHVSPDALLAAGTNLLGILAILNFERMHVISTKAFGLLTKLRF